MPSYNNINQLSRDVIGAAIEVHRRTGPGLLESAYQMALAEELRFRAIPFAEQVAIPLTYRTARVDCAYRADFIIDGRLIVEIKALTEFNSFHFAQLMTYLHLTGKSLGLLLNFHAVVLANGGIRRVVTPDFHASP